MTYFDSSAFLILWRKFATCIDNRKFVPWSDTLICTLINRIYHTSLSIFLLLEPRKLLYKYIHNFHSLYVVHIYNSCGPEKDHSISWFLNIPISQFLTASSGVCLFSASNILDWPHLFHPTHVIEWILTSAVFNL